MKNQNFSKEILEEYFNYKHMTKEIKRIEKLFKESNFNINNFEKLCQQELSEKEIYIVNQYKCEKRGLKSVAYELERSYPNIRKLYNITVEKMRLIISITQNE